MYFPIGWPKILNALKSPESYVKQVVCNRDRILFAVLTDDAIQIWYSKPCVPIVYHKRPANSINKFGTNLLAEWKPDSSKIVVATSEGHLLFYTVNVISDQKGLYVQNDSPHAHLRRDSAELFIKETIPALQLHISEEATVFDGQITSVVCITMTELMVATSNAHVLRYRWDGTQNRDYNIDLRRTPFCINQQVSKAVPIVEENTYIIDMEYSPLVGGFVIVLNDGRAAFLTASTLRFDPNQVQGIWAQQIEDATCASVNHKYRLITFGRANSECVVYNVDESTGGLALSHACVLSSKDYPGCPGAVHEIAWTPDGCAMIVAWEHGGVAMWSTFGALLMCSLGWDYGLNVDLQKNNPLHIVSLEWGTEGYQLWMVRKINNYENSNGNEVDDFRTDLIQMDFVKSALTSNPCMSHHSHLYLQGEDKLYVNSADTVLKVFASHSSPKEDNIFVDAPSLIANNSLAEGRQWLVVPVPSTYTSTNWPIRYSAIDQEGQNMVVAGRTGIAHYSMQLRKWKLFGNESQEKDFIVSGGLLWWRDYIVLGCYSIVDNDDEIRFYSRDNKLDNKFAKIVKLTAPILLMNSLQNQLITFGSDGHVVIWAMKQLDNAGNVEISKMQVVDITALCVHPACVASVTLTTLRTEVGRGGQHLNTESIVLNVSGRLLLVQREIKNGDRYGAVCSMPTVLASCVENVWVPERRKADKVHLTEALWLFCGSHGMRVWLPLYPRDGDKTHTFMSKRIMLPFHLRIYPLAILFEDAIILGAENDTVLYTSDATSPFSLPFSILQRTSQVYLHQILRQLIRRNLGYHAWEVARSCNSLPYFPHSLELLLHEVLEEEATSKEPIPDAQLPSVIEFIMEFPVYLQTVVQCARKTEIALWPYLFSAAGKPKDLFQECMATRQLDTAASYLIILQNLETSAVSRQYATLLLDTALEQSKWELAKDLVRFLRAIDPNDVDSPRNSMIIPNKLSLSQTSQPVSPNAEDISLVLGNVQRARSFSTTIAPKLPAGHQNTDNTPVVLRRKKSIPPVKSESNRDSSGSGNTAEEFFIDVILQRHARRLLSSHMLKELGYFAAYLDFHLVAWLGKERDRAARIDDFVKCLKHLHTEFKWPYPAVKNFPSENSPNELISIDEKFKSLQIETASSRVGDSGYISYPGLVTPQNTVELASQVSEVDALDKRIHLYEPMKLDKVDTQMRTNQMDEMSVVSSMWGEDRDIATNGSVTSNENWEVPSTQILEQLSNIGNKGPLRSEIQLRYLLQLFMEASCLEWSLLISVLLRDALAVVRTVNAAKSSEQSIEAVKRLKQGLQILHYWAGTECWSYKAFMLAIQNQISVLSSILATKIQHQQISEHQRVVSATLSKVTAGSNQAAITALASSNSSEGRTRKASASNYTGSRTSSRERSVSESNTTLQNSEGMNNVTEEFNNIANNNVDKETEPTFIPDSTGCVVS